MALVKGPFKFKWGTNVLNNVSDISIDYSVDTSDTTTLDGNTYHVQTGMTASVTLTLLDNDVAALATILPQYFVAAGGTLSTGGTAPAGGAGVIDIAAASCSTSDVYNDLTITACGTGASVLKLVHARTQVDSIDIGDGLRTVAVTFVGEPLAGQAVAQIS